MYIGASPASPGPQSIVALETSQLPDAADLSTVYPFPFVFPFSQETFYMPNQMLVQ